MKTIPKLIDISDEQRRVLCAEELGIIHIWSYALPEKTIRCDVPDPDNNAGDALALVEHIREEGWLTDLQQFQTGEWACESVEANTGRRECKIEDTLPRAITSAFLLAKGLALP